MPTVIPPTVWPKDTTPEKIYIEADDDWGYFVRHDNGYPICFRLTLWGARRAARRYLRKTQSGRLWREEVK